MGFQKPIYIEKVQLARRFHGLIAVGYKRIHDATVQDCSSVNQLFDLCVERSALSIICEYKCTGDPLMGFTARRWC